MKPSAIRPCCPVWLVRLLMAPVSCLVVACAVGPDYSGPPQLGYDLTTWQQESPAAVAADPTALGHWWSSFDDETLEKLIHQTLAANHDLAQAASRVREARAQRRQVGATAWPSLDLSGSAVRRKQGEADSESLYISGLDASWELDIFGRVQRSREAARADALAALESGRALRVSLLAEVALNYVDLCAFQTRLRLAAANVERQQQTYNLIKKRLELGLASELELREGESTLANTRAQIPPIEAGLRRAIHRLAVLVGKQPGALDQFLEEVGDIPVARLDIAIGIPADLLRRRPDIRQAERQLAAQTARIGVATADLYPRFTLNGTLSFQATDTADLFTSMSRAGSFGPAFQWNIFNAGSVRSNITVQNERQRQALLNYEKSVLLALEEVENAMVSYARELDRRRELQRAVVASRQSVRLARVMYMDGLRDFSHVLDSQRNLFLQEDQLAESHAAVTAHLIRLYKALGGGWAGRAAP